MSFKTKRNIPTCLFFLSSYRVFPFQSKLVALDGAHRRILRSLGNYNDATTA